MRQTLIDIATEHLRIRTLEPRNSDQLDFHEVYVSKLRDALEAAYKAGQTAIETPAIFSTLSALANVLQDTAALTDAAADAIAEKNQNLAIGTLLPLEDMLPTAQALFQAARALHRLSRKGGAL
jgi:hypothetical protein